MKRNDMRSRSHASWIAFCIHRVSGILLTIFLPVHFWTLGLALNGEASLDTALKWYEAPLFKFGEWLLVLLLAAHAIGGVRILLIEWRPWRGLRQRWITTGLSLAVVVSAAFIVSTLR